jgi:hypothetical protein
VTVAQSDNRANFEAWFGSKLTPLIEDPSAGFIVAMVAFPLLERYLRRKSGAKPSTKQFRAALLDIFRELGTDAVAEQFWDSYRHGLLHNVVLNMETHGLSPYKPALEVAPGNVIWMNPGKFAKRVLEKIRSDFPTFEEPKPNPLPQVFAIPGQPTQFGTGTPPPITRT